MYVDEMNYTEFLEFVLENFSETIGYIVQGKISIRIHRDNTGEMWFVDEVVIKRKFIQDV